MAMRTPSTVWNKAEAKVGKIEAVKSVHEFEPTSDTTVFDVGYDISDVNKYRITATINGLEVDAPDKGTNNNGDIEVDATTNSQVNTNTAVKAGDLFVVTVWDIDVQPV